VPIGRFRWSRCLAAEKAGSPSAAQAAPTESILSLAYDPERADDRELPDPSALTPKPRSPPAAAVAERLRPQGAYADQLPKAFGRASLKADARPTRRSRLTRWSPAATLAPAPFAIVIDP
jgi:hypothetical protein